MTLTIKSRVSHSHIIKTSGTKIYQHNELQPAQRPIAALQPAASEPTGPESSDGTTERPRTRPRRPGAPVPYAITATARQPYASSAPSVETTA